MWAGEYVGVGGEGERESDSECVSENTMGKKRTSHVSQSHFTTNQP